MDNVFQLDILGNDKPKDEKEKMVKYGFRIYTEDWEWIKEVVRFEILKNENLEYNNAKAISDAVLSLKEKYGKIKPRKQNIRYRPGRRESPKELKVTSAYLTESDVEYLKDYHFNSIFTKGNLDYSQMELFSELVDGLRKKYKGKIK